MAVQRRAEPLTFERGWDVAVTHLRAQGKPENTIATYRRAFFQLNATLLELGLAEVTPDGALVPTDLAPIAKVLAHWRSLKKQGGAPFFSESTLKTRVSSIAGTLKCLIAEGELTDSPLRGLHLRPGRTLHRARRVGEDEVRAALDFAHARGDLRMELYLALGFFCGLRISEVQSLTFGAALLDPRHIVLRRPPRGQGALKGGTERLVPRPPYVTDLLGRLLAETPHGGESDYVIQGRGGTMLSRDQSHRLFASPLKQVIKGFKYHLCRHYFTQALLARNVDIVRVAEFLGHKDIHTTYGYATELALDTKPGAKVAADLAEALRPRQGDKPDDQ